MNHHINTLRIKAVANALGDLREKVVFVGGATISLYPDRAVFEIRPTDDVDVIIEILNYRDRAELEEKLRLMGFVNDVESGVICRYKIQGIVVDIMPKMTHLLVLLTIGIQKVLVILLIMKLMKKLL